MPQKKKLTKGQRRDAKVKRGLKIFRRFCNDNPITAQDICAATALDYIHILEGKLTNLEYQLQLINKLYRELKELYEVQQKSSGGNQKT